MLGLGDPDGGWRAQKRRREAFDEEWEESRIRRWKRLARIDICGQLRQMMRDEEARFRGNQEKTIRAIMRGEDPIIQIIGTSGGKSLSFILPAYCGGEGCDDRHRTVGGVTEGHSTALPGIRDRRTHLVKPGSKAEYTTEAQEEIHIDSGFDEEFPSPATGSNFSPGEIKQPAKSKPVIQHSRPAENTTSTQDVMITYTRVRRHRKISSPARRTE